MNKKGVSWVIIAIVIIAVVVIGGVAYWAMTNTGGDGGNGGNGGDETPDVAGASSLSFDVSVTVGDVQETYTYKVKNLGTSEIMLRVEQTDAEGGEFIYILNEADQEAWIYYDGAWADMSDTFSTYWDTWEPALGDYQTNLADWAGTGEYSYSDDAGNSIVINNIQVDPTLDDSLFTHTE